MVSRLNFRAAQLPGSLMRSQKHGPEEIDLWLVLQEAVVEVLWLTPWAGSRGPNQRWRCSLAFFCQAQ